MRENLVEGIMSVYSKLLNNFEIKCELIANGVDITMPIESKGFEYTPIIKSLYDYDQLKTADIQEVPQELILWNENEHNHFWVRVRRNQKSPWRLFTENGRAFLKKDSLVFEVGLPEKPKFYDKYLEVQGEKKRVTQFVQKLGSDIMTIVINNNCEYYGRKKECHFCELKQTYDDTKLHAEYQKNSDAIAESIKIALEYDPTVKILAFNGGNWTKNNDATFRKYIDILEKTRKRVALDRWNSIEVWIVTMPPSDIRLIDKLKEAGATLVLFNLELWTQEAFTRFMPGKDDFGRQRMLDNLAYATKVFPKGNVMSCLIYGIQSIKAEPYAVDENREESILLDAFEHLSHLGVIQLINNYHQTGRNKIREVAYSSQGLSKFHREYGRRIIKKSIIAEQKLAKKLVWGSIGSIPNSLNNEAAMLASYE